MSIFHWISNFSFCVCVFFSSSLFIKRKRERETGKLSPPPEMKRNVSTSPDRFRWKVSMTRLPFSFFNSVYRSARWKGRKKVDPFYLRNTAIFPLSLPLLFRPFFFSFPSYSAEHYWNFIWKILTIFTMAWRYLRRKVEARTRSLILFSSFLICVFYNS